MKATLKTLSSILLAVFFAFTMAACDPNDIFTPDDSTGGNGNGGNGGGDNPAVVETDTTIMSYTLMRSLINTDWDAACERVLAMGFTEIAADEDNTRSFIKGAIMGDYYTCHLRCDFPEVDNLVGGVVIQEHHMNSSNQATCLENNTTLIYDQRRVLDDMNRDAVNCGGNIIWSDMQDNGQFDGPHESSYPSADGLDAFVTDLRAMEPHTSVTANWADSYIYDNMHYVASCSGISSSFSYASTTDNIITLAVEDLLDK